MRDVLNASGVVQDHTDYTAFGVITSQTSASAQGEFGWQGTSFDSLTGLQYHRARYYNPAEGSWTSQDPLGFGAGDVNLYRYVKNDPLKYLDPSGGKDIEIEDIRDIKGSEWVIVPPNGKFKFTNVFDYERWHREYGLGKLKGKLTDYDLTKWSCTELVEWMVLTAESISYRTNATAKAQFGDEDHTSRIIDEVAFLGKLIAEYDRQGCKDPIPKVSEKVVKLLLEKSIKLPEVRTQPKIGPVPQPIPQPTPTVIDTIIEGGYWWLQTLPWTFS